MKCPFSGCQFRTRSFPILKQHAARAHAVNKMSSCPFCNESFSDVEGLRKHCQFNPDPRHALLYFFLKPPRSKSRMWKEFRGEVFKLLKEEGVAIPCPAKR